MNAKKIDIINIGLIFIALCLAFKLPFELFLFSYVILGPLHYLTELNWLRDKNYFVHERKWIWVYILLCLLIAIPVLLNFVTDSSIKNNGIFKNFSRVIHGSYSVIILVMFLFAISLVYFKKRKQILFSFLASIAAGILIMKFVPFSFILVGIFLPTIIHVYLFTILFIIFGALNAKSKTGMIGALLLLICPIIIFAWKIDPSEYPASSSAQSSYITNRFSNVSFYISLILQRLGGNKFHFISDAGIRVQIFIAFCYTYHYLNWFSKTSVIGWNKLLFKTKFALIFLLWMCSIFLYWYDYKTGYILLFFLSILHVVLEFPLNITSIKGILSKVKFPVRLSVTK